MATTYLSRPVFDWPIDWARTPTARIEYDLREIDLGFGAEAYWGDQTHVIQVWQFQVQLDSETAIDAFDDWFADLNGRLVGFWLPGPNAAFEIVAGISTSSFKIRGQGLAANLNQYPELHVAFMKTGAATQFAKVQSCTANSDGTETVVLSAALATAVDSTWRAVTLSYVRLADDAERGEFGGEQQMVRFVRVVELPLEYVAYEVGTKPIYLYHFSTSGSGTLVHWRFTSFAWDLEEEEGDIVWLAKRITHTQLAHSTQGDREELQIEAEFEPESPLYQLCPCALAMPLDVEVLVTDYADLATQNVLFRGRVLSVDVKGKTATAKCASFLDVFGGTVPHFFLQPRCNYRLFEANTCRASQAAFEKSAALASAATTTTVQIMGSSLAGLPANWFAEGWIAVGTGAEFEQRTILASTAESESQITLTLNHRLFYAAVSDPCKVIPGCDGTPETCASKFSNFANFGGHRYALKNLTLKAMEVPNLDASKK
ncbi:MAG TPA: phage BR0599 family protein [Verrucomicrobiota bacterium]|nr:phage BR0599 family protein [Verrucomicrobiota bacterium]HNU51076.1 phage BR0599 family protein [Verrucomicrobiota bacterium]